ncbi:hypothetical protein TSUD_311660 [Trifolium subterraneum]|uniref:F-box domain-containing protein n=1 Tax=Trifolium subterraneum TaxID=3900 RepID=A0A2Z6LZ15_TRISU|nr:hypothetical protein TSUD_311660 [Trifolium subterraneum]
MEMGVDWSDLPQEIIESISKKLTIYVDYLRFRCVCRSWNSSVPKTPLHLPPQLPWLMISHNSFFDLSTNKIHHLNLPMPSGPTRICGSSHGWLVILKQTSELTLLNPITGATLSLPSLQTFPELVTRVFDYRHNNLYLIKVVLSASPSLSDDDFFAFAILNRRNFAFCKKGYDSWVLLDVIENQTWIDAIYNNGSFYVTSMSGGTFAVCDVEGPRISFIQKKTSKYDDNYISYALFDGEDMFLVHRYVTEEEEPQDLEPYPDMLTEMFWIYKMNWNVLEWEEIQTLGEHSVFIGKNSSLYFSAADFVGCRPNCIYFTDDAGKHDFGIYNVSSKRIDPLPCYPHKSNCGFGYPVWVTPNP